MRRHRPGRHRARTGQAAARYRRYRALQAVTVALVLAGLVISGITIARDGGGFAFFVFRNAGAGAGNPQNLGEDQGPGQLHAK